MQTDQPYDQSTDRPTSEQTDMKALRENTLPIKIRKKSKFIINNVDYSNLSRIIVQHVTTSFFSGISAPNYVSTFPNGNSEVLKSEIARPVTAGKLNLNLPNQFITMQINTFHFIPCTSSV